MQFSSRDSCGRSLMFYHPLAPSAVYHMKETGWERVSSTDVKELHYKYAEERS